MRPLLNGGTLGGRQMRSAVLVIAMTLTACLETEHTGTTVSPTSKPSHARTSSFRNPPGGPPGLQVIVTGSTFAPFIHAASQDIALTHGAVPVTDWHPTAERVSPIGSRKELPLGEPNYSAWADFLSRIHKRVHPVFADQYLSSLDALPRESPLNDSNLAVQIELQILQRTGEIETIGVRRSSGRVEFDVAALIAFSKAFPLEVPLSLASPDGRVYLLWELKRDAMACSTLFARPFRFE